jgi:hypothetical protein
LCSLAAIEKALIKSDLGLTPSNDGNVIRLTVPQLTADRRKELLKLVSRLTEDGKVALRNVRRDAMKAYDKLEKVVFLLYHFSTSMHLSVHMLFCWLLCVVCPSSLIIHLWQAYRHAT